MTKQNERMSDDMLVYMFHAWNMMRGLRFLKVTSKKEFEAYYNTWKERADLAAMVNWEKIFETYNRAKMFKRFAQYQLRCRYILFPRLPGVIESQHFLVNRYVSLGYRAKRFVHYWLNKTLKEVNPNLDKAELKRLKKAGLVALRNHHNEINFGNFDDETNNVIMKGHVNVTPEESMKTLETLASSGKLDGKPTSVFINLRSILKDKEIVYKDILRIMAYIILDAGFAPGDTEGPFLNLQYYFRQYHSRILHDAETMRAAKTSKPTRINTEPIDEDTKVIYALDYCLEILPHISTLIDSLYIQSHGSLRSAVTDTTVVLLTLFIKHTKHPICRENKWC